MKNQHFYKCFRYLRQGKRIENDSHKNFHDYIHIGYLNVRINFSSPYVFAVKPDPGFLGTLNCNIFAPGSPIKNTTCCWKESNGDRYCQTCQWEEGIGYTVCNDKELQMLDTPPNPTPSSPSGPSAPIQDDGVL